MHGLDCHGGRAQPQRGQTERALDQPLGKPEPLEARMPHDSQRTAEKPAPAQHGDRPGEGLGVANPPEGVEHLRGARGRDEKLGGPFALEGVFEKGLGIVDSEVRDERPQNPFDVAHAPRGDELRGFGAVLVQCEPGLGGFDLDAPPAKAAPKQALADSHGLDPHGKDRGGLLRREAGTKPQTVRGQGQRGAPLSRKGADAAPHRAEKHERHGKKGDFLVEGEKGDGGGRRENPDEEDRRKHQRGDEPARLELVDPGLVEEF